MDSTFNPIYSHPEALQILAYPENPEKIKTKHWLPEEVVSSLRNHRTLSQPTLLSEFLSGKRYYRCHAFSLNGHPKNGSQPVIALLIKRSASGPIDIARIAGQFHLTRREGEVVGFLIQGLTSKEISKQMRIRPNTVKTFLRIIMIKMKVSNRSGIIGKLVKAPAFI
jgi:DNA-binding CsgD family transcriptional regulator